MKEQLPPSPACSPTSITAGFGVMDPHPPALPWGFSPPRWIPALPLEQQCCILGSHHPRDVGRQNSILLHIFPGMFSPGIPRLAGRFPANSSEPQASPLTHFPRAMLAPCVGRAVSFNSQQHRSACARPGPFPPTPVFFHWKEPPGAREGALPLSFPRSRTILQAARRSSPAGTETSLGMLLLLGLSMCFCGVGCEHLGFSREQKFSEEPDAERAV